MQVAAKSLRWEPTWWSIRWYPGIEREKSRENYEQETIGFIPNEFIESFLNKNVFKTNSAMVEVETIFRLFV